MREERIRKRETITEASQQNNFCSFFHFPKNAIPRPVQESDSDRHARAEMLIVLLLPTINMAPNADVHNPQNYKNDSNIFQ